MKRNVLSIENLSFSYGSTEVLKNVSCQINEGDFVALAGPNGAGKTTLMKIVLGLEKQSFGRMELFGINTLKFKDWKKIGYLPQRVNTFNPLFPATAAEVVGLGLLSQKGYPKKFNRDDNEKISAILNILGIEDLKNKSISELSGGQQQRVFLARALVAKPDLLIMDEPNTALDPKTRESFFKLVERMNKEKGTTVIIITHDTAQAGQYANKLLYLDKTVIFYGKFPDFCNSSDMDKYFGRFAHHVICHQH